MKRQLKDRKSSLAHFFLAPVNRWVVHSHFKTIDITGYDNLPKDGPFILVCNHISRWDGLLVGDLIARPANYMVTPHELKGWQGILMPPLGSFPADPAYDLIGFVKERISLGEGLVIFPEGGISHDGSTQPFKNGAARMALMCAREGLQVPVIPVAVHYEGRTARVNIGAAVDLEHYKQEFAVQTSVGIRSLTVRLHREVCFLREALGSRADLGILYTPRPIKFWVARHSITRKPLFKTANVQKPNNQQELVGAGQAIKR